VKLFREEDVTPTPYRAKDNKKANKKKRKIILFSLPLKVGQN
jgi:hypothetical protein